MKTQWERFPLFCASLVCGLPAVLAGCGGSSASLDQAHLTGTNPGQSAYYVLEYRFSLPPGDTGTTGNEGPAYAALRLNCHEGAMYLTSTHGQGFRSPRNAVLFAAGIQLCLGNLQIAKQHFDHARTAYGFGGLAPDYGAECNLYRSIRSVLEQSPRTIFRCPEGPAPAYRTSADGRIDNPLTPGTDESTAPDPASGPDSLPTPSPLPGAGPVPPPEASR